MLRFGSARALSSIRQRATSLAPASRTIGRETATDFTTLSAKAAAATSAQGDDSNWRNAMWTAAGVMAALGALAVNSEEVCTHIKKQGKVEVS